MFTKFKQTQHENFNINKLFSLSIKFFFEYKYKLPAVDFLAG